MEIGKFYISIYTHVKWDYWPERIKKNVISSTWMYKLLENVKGKSLAEQKLQDLCDTGQEHDIWEQSQCRSSIDSIAETRGFRPDQRFTAMNICKKNYLDKSIYCVIYHDTPQLPQQDVCLFVFFWEKLQDWRADVKGQGDEWNWDAWYEIHKESKTCWHDNNNPQTNKQDKIQLFKWPWEFWKTFNHTMKLKLFWCESWWY